MLSGNQQRKSWGCIVGAVHAVPGPFSKRKASARSRISGMHARLYMKLKIKHLGYGSVLDWALQNRLGALGTRPSGCEGSWTPEASAHTPEPAGAGWPPSRDVAGRGRLCLSSALSRHGVLPPGRGRHLEQATSLGSGPRGSRLRTLSR